MTRTYEDVLKEIPDADDRLSLDKPTKVQARFTMSEHAVSLLQMRTVDRLATTLNWLTFVVAVATLAGVIVGAPKLF